MAKRNKKNTIPDEPKHKGSSIKKSRQVPESDYWLAQVALDDDAYYTMTEALSLIKNKRNERGI